MPTLSVSISVAETIFKKDLDENRVEKVYLEIQNNGEYCSIKYKMQGFKSIMGVWGIYKFSQNFVETLVAKRINMEIQHVEILDAPLPPHLGDTCVSPVSP